MYFKCTRLPALHSSKLNAISFHLFTFIAVVDRNSNSSQLPHILYNYGLFFLQRFIFSLSLSLSAFSGISFSCDRWHFILFCFPSKCEIIVLFWRKRQPNKNRNNTRLPLCFSSLRLPQLAIIFIPIPIHKRKCQQAMANVECGLFLCRNQLFVCLIIIR